MFDAPGREFIRGLFVAQSRPAETPPSEFGGKGTKSVQTDWNRAVGLWITKGTKGHETRERDFVAFAFLSRVSCSK